RRIAICGISQESGEPRRNRIAIAQHQQRRTSCVLSWRVLIRLFVLSLSIATGLTVEKLVLAVVAAVSPTILCALREIRRQNDTQHRIGRLKNYADSLWRGRRSQHARP